jgi:hypothetical protein
VRNLSVDERPDWRKSLLGQPLEGDELVRFIYMDEAGTSAKEPVSVVVGLVVHGDTQLNHTAQLIHEARQAIPDKYRENFISHAKSVWSDKKYRDVWSQEDRTAFLCRMMSIPYHARLAIAYAAVKRNGPPRFGNINGVRKFEGDHMTAFGLCLAMADFHMRKHCPSENAVVVAEDVTEMRSHLRTSVNYFKNNPFDTSLLPEKYRMFGTEPILAEDRILTITKIIDNVHFSAKNEALLLQVADACAFGIRKFFTGDKMAEVFSQAIHGRPEATNTLKFFEGLEYNIAMGVLFKNPLPVLFSYSISPQSS